MMIQFEPAAFLCDELDVRPLGRTSLPDSCSGQIYHIFNRVRLSRPEMTSIAVCGCVTDGKDGQDFYALDIYVFTQGGGYFLPVDESYTLFSTAGLLYARSLFAGLWDDSPAGKDGRPTAT